MRALDIATNTMTWESLRTFGRLSVDEATAQVRAMILAFVRAWAPDAPGVDDAAVTAAVIAAGAGRAGGETTEEDTDSTTAADPGC